MNARGPQVQAYTLQQVAETVLPSHWTDGVRWLQRRLRTGELSGYKVGHDWMMTQADVESLIDRHRNGSRKLVAAPADPPPPAATVLDGLSERSRRRLKVTA